MMMVLSVGKDVQTLCSATVRRRPDMAAPLNGWMG